ncbi:MAG: DUF177 domain-containing protein [Deltaproteobacteria bacterium]
MKIKVDDIPEAGLRLEVKEQGKALDALADGLDFSILSPVDAVLDIVKTGDGANVSGQMRTSLEFTCSRCLKRFVSDVDTVFNAYYVSGKAEAVEKGLQTGDMEINFLEDGAIDTDDVLMGQLSLDVPMQPLCSEGCKGLCKSCGEDLNQGECSCQAGEKGDLRFARLKDFKVK